MLQLLLESASSGHALVRDVPAPRVAPGRVLVRTAASLVSSGTEGAAVAFAKKGLLGKARARPDLVRTVVQKVRTDGLVSAAQATRARLDEPLTLGYSAAGTVIQVGGGVDDLRAEQRVACAGAGYAVHAEVVAVPRNLVSPVPDRVSDEEAAFATLGAIALHGFRLSDAELGETVAVVGLGLVGLLAGQIARAAGCRVLGVDPDRSRTALALDLGFDHTVVGGAGDDGEAVELAEAVTGGLGVDAVLITAATRSSGPVELAGELCRDRGRVIVVGDVGMDVPRAVYYEKELDLRVSRSYGPGRYDPSYEEGGVDYPAGWVRWTEGRNLGAFLELVAARKVQVKPLISHRFPIARGAEAYSLLTGETGESSLGIVLEYPGAATSAAESAAVARRVELAELPAAATDTIRVGVLGAGAFSSRVLLPILKKDKRTVLGGVCTATGASARHAGDRFGFAYCTTDEAELLADGELDAVVVATRHHLHADQVAGALEAGKHVFCEKPLCLDRAELRRVIRAYGPPARARRLLMVGYNRRFATMGVRLREFFGEVAEPVVAHYRVNAGFIAPDHWVQDPEQGGGRIVGEVCHFVDFLVALTGGLPRRVHARGPADPGRYRSDNLVVTLELSDGSVGSILYTAAGDEALGKERCEVFGGGRSAVLDNFRSLKLVSGGHTSRHHHWLRQDKGHRAEWHAFRRAAIRGGEPPISLHEVVATSLATFAAVESLRSGEPVAVDASTFIGKTLEGV